MAVDAPAGPRLGLGRIFQRKSVAMIQAEFTNSELKRSLNALNLILLGIGCIIGTGIFVLTGTAAANYAGPAIMISFVITGILCAFVGLCYAELASALPVSGSAYSYTYASMGEGRPGSWACCCSWNTASRRLRWRWPGPAISSA